MLKSIFRALPTPVRQTIERRFYRVVRALPQKWKIQLLYYKSNSRFANLKNPSSFTEKVQARKIANRDYSMLVDKVLVKDYVRRVYGPDILIPTLFSGPQLPPRSERDWPVPYVIKTNNSSGTNIFVTGAPDWDAIEAQLTRFEDYNLSNISGELFYENIRPQYLIEPMIGDGKTPLIDYKFYTFDGRVEHIQVDTDRLDGHRRSLYSPDWSKLPIKHLKEAAPDLPRPECLADMIRIAGMLGKGFGFIRVDLYEADGKVYFGELTLTPGAGFQTFEPRSYDAHLGALWKWPDPVVDFAGSSGV